MVGNGSTLAGRWPRRAGVGVPSRRGLVLSPPMLRMLARGEFGIRNSEFPPTRPFNAKTQRRKAHPPNQGQIQGQDQRQGKSSPAAAATVVSCGDALEVASSMGGPCASYLAPLPLCVFALNRVGGRIQHPASSIQNRASGGRVGGMGRERDDPLPGRPTLTMGFSVLMVRSIAAGAFFGWCRRLFLR